MTYSQEIFEGYKAIELFKDAGQFQKVFKHICVFEHQKEEIEDMSLLMGDKGLKNLRCLKSQKSVVKRKVKVEFKCKVEGCGKTQTIEKIHLLKIINKHDPQDNQPHKAIKGNSFDIANLNDK